MDDKNVVKKRVTLAIAFAVFIVVVIAVILLIKPVMSKVEENRTAKVSQENFLRLSIQKLRLRSAKCMLMSINHRRAQVITAVRVLVILSIRMHLMYSMVQWIHQMRKETAS